MAGLNLLVPVSLAIVVAGIVMAFGVDIMSDLKSGAGTAAANTSIDQGITGISSLSAKVPTIAKVVGAAIILGIIVGLGSWGAMRQR